MRRRRRLLILGGLCLVALLVLAGTWFLSRTQWAQGELRQGLAHLISRELELPVRLSDFTLSFRPNTFEIRQLEILDPAGQAVLLTIDRLRVSLEWTSLLRRVTRVESVTVANPTLILNDSPKLRDTLSQLLSRLQAMAKERPATRFPVEVTGGALRYVNEAEGVAAQGDKIEIALHWRDPERAQVVLQVGTARVERGGLTLTDLAAAGKLEITKEKSVIEELELRHKQATARLHGSVTHQPITFTLTGKTELDLEELSALLNAPKPFAGMLAVNGSVSGGATPLTVTGTASLPETGVMWGVPLKRFTGRFTYQSNRVEVETLYAEGFGGNVSGHATLSLPKFGYTADLRFQSLRLAELIKQSGRSLQADGWLTGQAKLSGEGTNGTALAVESALTADQLQLMGRPRGAHAVFRGRLAKRALQITELTLTRGRSRATAKGRVELATHELSLSVRTEVEDLAEDLWPVGVNGHVAGRLTLAGTVTRTWDDPLFTGQVKAERMSIEQRTVDLLEGRLTVNREGLTSQRLRLKIGESTGELSGRAKFAASPNGSPAWVERLRPSIKLSVRGRAEDLLPLIPIKAPVKGQLVLSLEAEGRVENLEGNGSLTLSKLELYGDRVESVRARFTLRGDALLVPELVVIRQGLTLRGEGELNRSGAYRFTSHPLLLDLASLPRLHDHQVRGRIVLSARGAGQLDKPQIDGQMTVSGLRVGDHSFGDGSGRFALAGPHWEWELALASGYQARGRLPLRLAGPFQAEIQAESADVTHWLRGVDLRHPLTAKANGRAVLEGDLGEPSGVRVTVDVTSATGRLGPAEWQTSRPVRLEIQQGKVRIGEGEVTGPLLDVTLSGEVVPHQTIALQIRAVAPYALVAPWVPVVGDYRGRPAIDLTLSGAPKALTVSGRARLERMEIKLTPLPFWVQVEQGDVSFKNDAIEFQIRQGAVHGGRLESTGTVVKTGGRWRHAINYNLDYAEFGAMLASLNPGSRWAEGSLFASGALTFETGAGIDPFQTLDGRVTLRAEGGTLSRYPGLVKAFGVVDPGEDARLPDLTQERMPYRQIVADFTITKGLMQTKNLLLDSRTVRMSGVGDIKLPEREVDFRLALQPLDRLERGMRRIPVLKRLFPSEQQLLVVYLNANGPLVEPHVAVAPIKTLSQNIVDLLLFVIRAPDRLLIPGDAR